MGVAKFYCFPDVSTFRHSASGIQVTKVYSVLVQLYTPYQPPFTNMMTSVQLRHSDHVLITYTLSTTSGGDRALEREQGKVNEHNGCHGGLAKVRPD